MSVELARKALELEAERDKLKAEVDRLKGNLSADALAHEAEVSAIRKSVNLQNRERDELITHKNKQIVDMTLQLRAARNALDEIQDQALVPQSDQKDYMKCPDIAINAIQEMIKLGYTEKRVCVKCGKGSERFYSDRCPSCYDTLAAGQE